LGEVNPLQKHMKVSTLYTLATASLLAFALTGCKQTPIRTTVLPGHSAAGDGLASDQAKPLDLERRRVGA